MEKSPSTGAARMLIEAMRMQVDTRQRLRELQSLTHPTDDERDEAWILLRTVRTLAAQSALALRKDINNAHLESWKCSPL